MDGSISGAIVADYRNFQKHLLFALIASGALTKEQAAAVCTATADTLREEKLEGRLGQAMLPALAIQNEDIASLILSGEAMRR